jgi:predicted GNAT family acetyltransferase
MSERAAITVTENADRNRFDGTDDSGVVAGFVEYERHGNTVDLVHTEVDEAFEGRGVGSSLVRGVLDELRGQDVDVTVSCPFIKSWLEKHPDYQDLTAR